VGGALRQALDIVREEMESRSTHLINQDFETPEGLNEARKLQGQIKGGLIVLDRIEELIRERASTSDSE